MAFGAVVVELGDGGHALRHLFRVEIAENDRQLAGAEPLRNAGAHHAGTDDRGARDRLEFDRRRRTGQRSFLRPLLEKEHPDQIAAGFRLHEFENGIALQRQ